MASSRETQHTPQPPPSDFDAEQAVLGCALLEPGATDRAIQIVSAEDFYWEAHQTVFAAIAECVRRHEPVDLVTVSAELRRINKLQEIGGGTYLTALMGQVPTAAHVARYATIVAEKAQLRRLAGAGADTYNEAMQNPASLAQAVAAAKQRIAEVEERMVGVSVFSPQDTFERDLDSSWKQFAKHKDPVSPERFGMRNVDAMMGGLRAHKMLVIKASRKDGKSQLLRKLAIETARQYRDGKHGKFVLYVGTEEDWDLWKRFAWSHISGIDSKWLTLDGWWATRSKHHPGSTELLYDAQEELRDLPFRFMFQERDWAKLKATIYEECRRRDIGMVVIDYFQRLYGGVGKTYNEEHDYRLRARDMVSFGVELNIPVVTASQVTMDPNTKRMVTKGASAIEEEAFTLIDWKREMGQGNDERLDVGELSCVTARLGTWFKKQTVRTDMRYGEFWDQREFAAEDAAGKTGEFRGRLRCQQTHQDAAAENADPFEGGM